MDGFRSSDTALVPFSYRSGMQWLSHPLSCLDVKPCSYVSSFNIVLETGEKGRKNGPEI